MTLILSRSDVLDLLLLPECIEAVERPSVCTPKAEPWAPAF